MSDFTLSPRGPFYELKMHRPPLNVLNIAMLQGMIEALERAQKEINRSHGLILTAEGKTFSAGVDVGDHVGDKAPVMLKTFHRFFLRLAEVAVPTIAVVQGAALGGGCEVVMACDVVLASDKAVFAQPEIRVGVFPPVAAMALPGLIGWRRAVKMLLTGDSWDATTAHQWGFVTEVYPAESFHGSVEKFLSTIGSLSQPVLAYTLQAMKGYRSSKMLEDRITGLEDLYLNRLMKTRDAQEGLAAFTEKRLPKWSHQ